MATGSSSIPKDPKCHETEKKMELDFPRHPFKTPPYSENSLFYPLLPPEYYSSILPVFPGFNSVFLDTFHPFLQAGEDGPPEKSRFLEQQFEIWSITKAARSKRKMERQKSSNGCSRLGGVGHLQHRRGGATRSSISGRGSWALLQTTSASYDGDFINHPMPDNNQSLKFVLHKELKKSDVSTLGRIILPKREAEANLPYLTAKEGIHITVRDLASHQLWCMRYRFWPNNRSRMYVLEYTGDFIKKHDLRIGDVVVLYKDENNHLFICGTKVERPPPCPPLSMEREFNGEDAQMSELMDGYYVPMHCNSVGVGQGHGHYDDVTTNGTSSVQMSFEMGESVPARKSLIADEGDALSTVNPGDCDFSHLERLPDFEDCDLSLYDDNNDDGGDDKKNVDRKVALP